MERIILIITLLIAMPMGVYAQDSLDSLMNRELDEVVVTAQRKYTKPTARGLKVSMSGNPLSKIGSATDAIMQMPLIDGSAGSISVLGKGAPMIYINGRKMMSPSELANLKSSDLASVEIITNPSAEYGSDVSAVILIKTKQPLAGLYVSGKGMVQASEEWSESAGASTQYHNEKGLTVFGDISYAWDGFKQKRHYTELFREILNSDKFLTTVSDEKAKKTQSVANGGWWLELRFREKLRRTEVYLQPHTQKQVWQCGLYFNRCVANKRHHIGNVTQDSVPRPLYQCFRRFQAAFKCRSAYGFGFHVRK